MAPLASSLAPVLVASVALLAGTAPALATCPVFATAPPRAPSPDAGVLLVVPPSGPAPLDVDVRWFHYPFRAVARFDFDFDGDGTIDVSAPMEGDHYPRQQHRFTTPGRYTVTVHLHAGDAHRPVVLREPVEVFSPAALEAELQGRWRTLKDALRRRDVPAALDCLTFITRERYERIFRELFVVHTTDVEDVLTSIRLVRHGRAYALYEMVRSQNSRPSSFEVRFVIDGDGVWRLHSF
jgi:hypothetical protein